MMRWESKQLSDTQTVMQDRCYSLLGKYGIWIYKEQGTILLTWINYNPNIK